MFLKSPVSPISYSIRQSYVSSLVRNLLRTSLSAHEKCLMFAYVCWFIFRAMSKIGPLFSFLLPLCAIVHPHLRQAIVQADQGLIAVTQWQSLSPSPLCFPTPKPVLWAAFQITCWKTRLESWTIRSSVLSIKPPQSAYSSTAQCL